MRGAGPVVVVVGLGCMLLVAPRASSQGAAESKATLVTESRPRLKGSEEVLRRSLAEHAEARHKGTKESLARAGEIDRELLDHDWSAIDVPAVTYAFTLGQEQKARDRKIEGWDFDRLPPALVKMATSGMWAAFVEQRLDALIDHAGSVSWKTPKSRRNAANDLMKSRAFEKVVSHLATHLAAIVDSVPRADLKRMCDAFFRVYEDYDLETVQLSTQYAYLPAGYYLQWAAWLGDRRALRIASLMIDAWFSMPRGSREVNLVDAVRAVDLFNNRLDPAREPERTELIARIKADARIPRSVKAFIRAAP